MNIGVSGVRTHMRRLYDDYDVQDRTSMVLRTVHYFRKEIEEVDL